MAIDYTGAYKYNGNSAKISNILTRAFNKYMNKKFPYVYFPSGLKQYKTLVMDSNSRGGLAGFFNAAQNAAMPGSVMKNPCVYHLTAVDLSAYTDKKFHPSAVPPYATSATSAPIMKFVGITATLSQMISSGFDTLLVELNVYDNSYDGTYSNTNQRVKYAADSKALGVYLTAPQSIRYENGNPKYFNSPTAYEYIFNLNCLVADYVTRGTGSAPAMPSGYTWILTNVLDEIGGYFAAVNTSCTAVLDNSGYVDSWSGLTDGFQGFICNRKKLVEFLNAVGIPFTFDNNIASMNTDEFTDYISDGQPQNPTDDGGDPYGDNNSDDMDLPDVQVTPTNVFSRLSCCNISNLNNLSNFLFTATFYDNIKLLTNDPLESLCTVMYYPFDVYNHSTCGAEHQLTLANVPTPANVADLDVTYNMKLNMGEIDITPYYGSYLDYSPHTEIELYLPYRGYVNLPTNDIMGKHLSVMYMIDFYSGAATILVYADTELIHVDSAQIGINIPISQSNANSRAIALTSAAVGAVGTIAAGAIGGAAGGAAGAALAAGQAAAQTAAPTASRILNAAQNHVDKGGSMGGVGWLYAPQKCAVIYNRPILAEPKHYKTLNGYSTSYSGLVSAYKGFLQADVINGTTTATDTENAMILNLLRDGIFV